MTGLATLDREAIARACEQHGVARLRVFGSATTDRFDSATSDLDFLVDFLPGARRGIRPYLALKEDLERISGRPVDLLEAPAVRNPYFARRAFSEAVEGGQDVPPATLLQALALISDGSAKVVIVNAQAAGAETTQVEDAAKAANVPVLKFSEILPAGQTYAQWMQQNVTQLADALGN